MTTAAAALLGLLLLGGVILLVVGVVLGRRSLTTSGATALIAPAMTFAIAFACLSLFAAGFVHFGGREEGRDDGSPYLCSAAWTEFASVRGNSDDLQTAPYCHERAVHAVPATVGVSIVSGAVAAVCATAMLWRRRRRFDTALRAIV